MTFTITAVFALIAVLVSIAASIGIFMLVFSKRFAPDILLFFVASTAGSAAYLWSSRDFSLTGDIMAGSMGAETWAGRLANMSGVALCLTAALQIGLKGVVSRTSVILVAATLQYYFVCFLMPASFDRWFEFDHKMLYPIAALMILMMPSLVSARTLAVNFGRAATIPAAMSLLMIFVNYNSAVRESYQSILPFFTGRLYGATPHPNILGPICAFAVLLLTSFPPTSRWERYGLVALNLIALLLCQSKTSWATTLLAVAIVQVPSLLRFRRRIPAFAYVGLFAALAAVPALLSVMSHATYEYWSGNQTLSNISTLTGRTDIWQATLFLVKSHLVTGPGWETYLVYMQSLFPALVPNPHNLYLATLVQAGLVGIVAIAIFLSAMIVAAARLSGRERLFSLAYIVMFCVRGMSESSTFQLAFLAPTFWTLLMYMRLLAVMNSERKAAAISPLDAPRAFTQFRGS